ncbi:Integrase catalytic domain-containing protein [Abeliophyllum distichum]|uniref:Integrase catalytic domain-containing protein n=1 Tax=Abeliophyllum distichum TaxID=126358 RepID=A0ABD1VAV5_9LAMI
MLQGKLRDGLYQLEFPYQNNESTVQKSVVSNKSCSVALSVDSGHESLHSQFDVWHRRLGHPSSQVVSQVLKNCNQKLKLNEAMSFCDACQYGKSHSLPFSLSTSHAKAPLELIYTDVWGQAPIQSVAGFKYYIAFLDDFSRFTWIYPMKHKSEALSIFTQFKTLVENKLDRKIKTLQSDWGGEYRSFTNLVIQSGIEFRHPCPHTSAQNGRIERKHRHITETGLTLLAQAKMPLKYCESHKGYKCLSPTGKIYISRHVVFNETEFPFKSTFLVKKGSSPTEHETVVSWFQIPSQLNNSTPESRPADTIQLDATQATRYLPSSLSDTSQSHTERDDVEIENQNQELLGSINEQNNETETELQNFERFEIEDTTDHDNLQQSVSNEPREKHKQHVESHPMVTRAKAGVFKPKVYSRSGS